MNTQRLGSLFRQGLAVAGIAAGIVTAPSVTSTLPAWLSGILAGAGALILGIEHFVSDPSTGTPAPPSQETKSV